VILTIVSGGGGGGVCFSFFARQGGKISLSCGRSNGCHRFAFILFGSCACACALFVRSCVRAFVRSCVRALVRSCVRAFVRCFCAPPIPENWAEQGASPLFSPLLVVKQNKNSERGARTE